MKIKISIFALWLIVLIVLSVFSLRFLYSKSIDTITLLKKGSNKYDVIIVPGYPLRNGKIPDVLQKRIKWAVHLYKSGLTKNIIFTGAAVYSPYFESKSMALCAKKMGIASINIFTDTIAEYSVENIMCSYKLCKINGFNKIAIATDAIQTRKMRKYVNQYNLPIDFVPYTSETVKNIPFPKVDNFDACLDKNFKHIENRQNFIERIAASRGANIDKCKEY